MRHSIYVQPNVIKSLNIACCAPTCASAILTGRWHGDGKLFIHKVTFIFCVLSFFFCDVRSYIIGKHIFSIFCLYLMGVRERDATKVCSWIEIRDNSDSWLNPKSTNLKHFKKINKCMYIFWFINGCWWHTCTIFASL